MSADPDKLEPGYMYLDYWGLKEKPFENTPDPRFLYPSKEHREGLQRLVHTISGEKGCALLTGEYGCGKTILIRTVLANLSLSDYDVALINYPIFDRENFLREILNQFGKETAQTTRLELFRELSRYLYENATHSKRSLLVIDEAQLLDDPHVFEELRLLLNIQLEDRFLLTIVLIGQPELREKILLYPQLEQRIAIRYHLHRFDHLDTARYIRHRLRVAGSEKAIFTDAAMYLVYKICNGVPRRINNLCNLCLVEGMHRRVDSINEDIIKYTL